MIVAMQIGATEEQIQAVCAVIRQFKLEPLVLPGDRTAVGIPQAIPAEIREDLEGILGGLEMVSKVTPTSRPYKLASREWARASTVIEIKGAKIGAGHFSVMAGPCSVESEAQFRECGQIVRDAGGKVLRGGAFKPRTSPYAFQGMGIDGLKIIQAVGEEFGLVTITEAMSPDQVAAVAEYADVIQIGARSMQNFPLLIEAGKSGKPVFLKRGPSSTIDEFLLAGEYVMAQGNPNVMLCERGVTPIDRSYTRNTLDLNSIPVLKEYSHLPVFADPAHGCGVARYVPALAKAALAAGADGVMVEMHPDPKKAMSDGAQSLDPKTFQTLMNDLRSLSSFFGAAM